MTETELIAACKKNDRIAQRTLYDKYKRAMYTLAYRLTGNFDDADDVLQDAFIDIFRNLQNFRGESTIGAWIKTIVIRKAYKKIKGPVMPENIEDYQNVVITLSHEKIDAEYLEKAILSLPDGYRTVFLMLEIEGYTHKEVSEVLGITEGTSKSQLFYAKKRLREMLK
ncbi:MAG: RNA polymerase sigma factor [Cytophagaceae bacterium]|nr:RNA polymerase sigma factor [Cytophagaceae bacterium]MBK9934738.1 RNA polymerase sigma factor [Cytophagaceae bacterium]MBL0301176.1 RNA polymerase sigma factor [Cytophagaceae bacterium]MBL0323993.1 RNA polymerase sigma factor [Cytophagaceae bacterium]